MNPEDVKNQIQQYGGIVRDKEFFKKAEETIKQFMKTKSEPEEEPEEEEFLDA